jgi:hypothetical protein
MAAQPRSDLNAVSAHGATRPEDLILSVRSSSMRDGVGSVLPPAEIPPDRP